jgi:ribonuclease BN (tRNA processing enzyme)
MKIKFIGTGQMTTKRRNTSFVIDDVVLVDVGSGVVRGLIENGLDVEDVRVIVVSHFHSDHFGDIAYYLPRRALQGNNEKPLMIIGPKGIEQKVIDLQNLLFGDVRDFSNVAELWNIKFIEIEDGKTISACGYDVMAFDVVHGGAVALGYIITSGDKSVGYTGDACLTPELVAKIPSAGTWIMEANSVEAVPGAHIGFGELVELAGKHKDTKFYAVHRSDYQPSAAPSNVFCPMDDDEVVV